MGAAGTTRTATHPEDSVMRGVGVERLAETLTGATTVAVASTLDVTGRSDA
jgi:hypothetical protein